jgi:hypothetical protein
MQTLNDYRFMSSGEFGSSDMQLVRADVRDAGVLADDASLRTLPTLRRIASRLGVRIVRATLPRCAPLKCYQSALRSCKRLRGGNPIHLLPVGGGYHEQIAHADVDADHPMWRSGSVHWASLGSHDHLKCAKPTSASSRHGGRQNPRSTCLQTPGQLARGLMRADSSDPRQHHMMAIVFKPDRSGCKSHRLSRHTP